MLNLFIQVGASLLNSPAKKLAWIVGIDDKRVDDVYVDLKNRLHEEKFKKVPKNERILVLPHCLRSKKCEAKRTDYGYSCAKCGRCSICNISNEAEKHGYSVFIVPGSSVISKIVKKEKPKAILGVACNKEIVPALMILEKYGIAAQAVPLIRDGCVNTIADCDSIFEKIQM